MRGKLFLTVFFITLLSVIGFFYFKSFKPLLSEGQNSSNQRIIQILPYPHIISNVNGKRSEELKEILLKKKEKSVVMHNVTLDFSSMFQKKKLELKNAYMKFSYNKASNKVDFNGHFKDFNKLNKVNGSYYYDAKNNIIVDFEIKSDIHSVKVSTSYTPYEKPDEGILNGKISFVSNDLFESYAEFQNLSKILGVKFRKNENARFEGEFEYDKDFTLKNSNFTSDNTEFNIALKGDSNKKFDLITKLDIKNINFDKIFTRSSSKGMGKFISLASILLNEYANSYEVSGEVLAEKIFINKNLLTNLDMKIDCNENKIAHVKDFKVDINSNTQLYTKGEMSNSQFRPIYTGKMKLESTEASDVLEMLGVNNPKKILSSDAVNITSDVIITPIMMNVSNLKATDGDFNGIGNIRASYYSEDFKTIYGALELNDIDSNKDNIFKRVASKYNGVFKGNKDNLVSKMLNFKKVKSIYDMSLKVNNLKYNEKKIDKLKANIVLRPDVMAVHDLTVDSPASNFTGHYIVDVSKEKPKMSLKLHGDSIDGEILSSLFMSSDEEVRSKTHKLEEKSIKHAAYKVPNKSIRFFRFDQFNGELSLDFKDVLFDSDHFKNLSFKANMDNGLIKVSKMNIEAFNGYLQSVGNVTLSPFAFNLALSYSGGNFGDIMENIFQNSKVSGKMSMTGNLYGKGGNIHDLIANTGGVFNYRISKTEIGGFNIKALLNTYGADMPKDFDVNLQKGKTNFKLVSGKAVVDNGKLRIKDSQFAADKVDGKISSEIDLFTGAQSTVASFAYVGDNGKVDGFNISFIGPINDPKVKLGVDSLNN